MKQLTGERILGTATILVGFGAMVHAVQLGFRLNDEDMGVGLFPLIIGGCLVLCGIYHVLSAGSIQKSYKPLAGNQIKLLLKVFAGLVVYVTAMEYLGYLIATFLFVTYLTKLLGAKSWVKTAVMGIVTTLAFSAVFQVWMQMPLPTGLFNLLEVL